MLLGWIRDDQARLGARSTAGVLAFYAIGGFTAPTPNRFKIMDSMTTLPEVDAVAQAIATSHSADAGAWVAVPCHVEDNRIITADANGNCTPAGRASARWPCGSPLPGTSLREWWHSVPAGSPARSRLWDSESTRSPRRSAPQWSFGACSRSGADGLPRTPPAWRAWSRPAAGSWPDCFSFSPRTSRRNRRGGSSAGGLGRSCGGSGARAVGFEGRAERLARRRLRLLVRYRVPPRA